MSLPENWRVIKIDEVCSLCYGKFLSQANLDGGGFPVFSGYRVVGTHSVYLYAEPQLIMVCRGVGGSGDVKFSPPMSWITNLSIVIQPDEDVVLKDYLYWALLVTDRTTLITGSAQHQVTISALKDHLFHLPPLPEQRRIAAVLGTLDDKIELNRKMNQTLEALAQALFKSWFVDFDGHDDLVESEMGPVPRGWEVKSIGDVVPILGGGTPSTKQAVYWEGGVHAWVTPKDLSGVNVPVLLEAQRFITDAGLQRISSGLLPQKTFLLSSRAPIGYVAITQIPLAINQGFIAIPPNDVLSSAYLLFWTMSNMESIKGRAGGTTFAEISKRAFRPIPILVPPEDVLSEYDAVADLIIERIAMNELESRTLAELRDTLLPKLISGELRVSEAEALVAEVV